MKKNNNFRIALIISLAFLLLYNITAFAYECDLVRNDTLRLHVIANSDTDEDQALKLKVRDAVLSEGISIFDGSTTIDNAIKKITPEILHLKKIAENTIKSNGYNYPVNVTLDTEYFDTRTYNDEVTLPAGKYLALKIIIGEGKGKNWWCVMFPSLCLPAATGTDKEAIDDVYSDGEEHVVLSSSKYEVRFKIVEWIEKMKDRSNNH